MPGKARQGKPRSLMSGPDDSILHEQMKTGPSFDEGQYCGAYGGKEPYDRIGASRHA